MGECDVNDILCELRVIQSLENLQRDMTEPSFIAEFPELEGLGNRLLEKIDTSREEVRMALAECGNIELGEIEAEVGASSPPSEEEEYG